jgi:hypothetical protein
VNTESFNYNANNLLIEAIAAGERGAYWALLSDMMDRQNKREQNNNSFSRHGEP